METVLGEELIDIATSNATNKEPTKEIECVYLGSIQGGELKSSISDTFSFCKSKMRKC